MKKLKIRDTSGFEKFVRHHKLSPVCKVTEPDGTEILIADGLVDTTDPVHGDFFKDYPNGLYQTAWAVARGELDIASWVEFDRYHDYGWPLSKRQSGRVNAALEMARQFIRQSKEAGRYRGLMA